MLSLHYQLVLSRVTVFLAVVQMVLVVAYYVFMMLHPSNHHINSMDLNSFALLHISFTQLVGFLALSFRLEKADKCCTKVFTVIFHVLLNILLWWCVFNIGNLQKYSRLVLHEEHLVAWLLQVLQGSFLCSIVVGAFAITCYGFAKDFGPKYERIVAVVSV